MTRKRATVRDLASWPLYTEPPKMPPSPARDLVWGLIESFVVSAPLVALWYSIFGGHDPAWVRHVALFSALVYFLGRVTNVSWRFGVWPWLRHLRLRWPVYVAAPAMVLNIAALTPEEIENFKAYWDKLKRAPIRIERL